MVVVVVMVVEILGLVVRPVFARESGISGVSTSPQCRHSNHSICLKVRSAIDVGNCNPNNVVLRICRLAQ